MPEALPFINLGALGVLIAVLYYLIRQVSSGALVPRGTVDVLLSGRDAEIVRSNERADEWQKAFEGERHVSELVRDQNRELIEVARTVEHVLESLALLAEGRHRDVAP